MINKDIEKPSVAAQDYATFTEEAGQQMSSEKTKKMSLGQRIRALSQKTHVPVISIPDNECPVPEKTILSDELKAHIKSLSKMELRKEFKKEANSHRNMLQRVKSYGAVVHPDFHDFRSFLLLVGPMPTKNATLDRINNDDPEYAPGKVRWADKKTQNSNKSDTLTFYCSKTGKTFTSFQLAKKQNVDASTIRKRRERGWSDDEIIVGSRNKAVGKGDPANSGSSAQTGKKDCAEARQVFIEEIKQAVFGAMDSYLRSLLPEYDEDEIPKTYQDMVAYCNEQLGRDELNAIHSSYASEIKNEIWPRFKSHVLLMNLPVEVMKFLSGLDQDWYEEQVSKQRKRKK
nr:hypothetical protein [uncultured Cohaesibacter sp.]